MCLRDTGTALTKLCGCRTSDSCGLLHTVQAVVEKQQAALTAVGAIEEAMVKGFPFEVPAAYDNLPQLKVRSRHSGAPKTFSRTGCPLDHCCERARPQHPGLVPLPCQPVVRLALQGRATVEMGLTFKSARDNGIKGGTMRIVSDLRL